MRKADTLHTIKKKKKIDKMDLSVVIVSSRIITNIHSMNISRRKKQKMLLTSNNSIKIFIMILMKPSLGKVIPNPQINGVGCTPQSFSSPSNLLVAVPSKSRILFPQAIILLLSISHHTIAGILDFQKGLGERDFFDMGGSETEGMRGMGGGGEGISIARGSEVEGNRGGTGQGIDKVIRASPQTGGCPVMSP